MATFARAPFNLPWRADEDSLDDWGRRGWRWAHCRTIRYPASPSVKRRHEELAAFWAFVSSLPCLACRAHAAAYARKHPPDFTGRAAYQEWMRAFHNSVNARTGKPPFTRAQFLAHYREDLAKALSRYLR